MKYTIRFTLATLAVAAAVVSTNAPAHADYDFAKVADPHIPAPEMGWCLGGSGAGALFVSPFCDGERYPDGSFWHMTGIRMYGARNMFCVMDNGGNPNPPPAPPGGCGGAALGEHHIYHDGFWNGADYDFSKIADPHIPNLEMGWCRGGLTGSCDGEHYPDGSFWRFTKDFVTYARHWDCVMDNGGNPNPPLAPPGGCGGAVK